MRLRFLTVLISASLLTSCNELLPLVTDILLSRSPQVDTSPSPETPPPASSEKPAPPIEVSAEPPTGVYAEVLAATNQERQSHGLEPLKYNRLLAQAAQEHAENMAAAQRLEHTLNGSSMTHRIEAVGYAYRQIAENISMGYATPAETVAGWMNSPGHRANILTPELEELGVGYALSEDGSPYWVQNFGRPL